METPRKREEPTGRVRAAVYSRVRQEVAALEAQRRVCLRFAEESGYDVAGLYEETGVGQGEGEEIA